MHRFDRTRLTFLNFLEHHNDGKLFSESPRSERSLIKGSNGCGSHWFSGSDEKRMYAHIHTHKLTPMTAHTHTQRNIKHMHTHMRVTNSHTHAHMHTHTDTAASTF